MLHLRTFGALDLRTSENTSAGLLLAQPRSTALLVYLLLARPDEYLSRDSLCALFWPDADQEHARGALSQALTRIRRQAGHEIIQLRGRNEIRVTPGAVACDVTAFHRATAAGQHGVALEIYTGPFLLGFHVHHAPGFESWAERERDRLRLAAAASARALARDHLDRGRLLDAGQAAARALRLTPESEATAAELVRSLAEAGDRAGALALFDGWAGTLARDLDLEPTAELQALALELREAATPAGDPGAASLDLHTGPLVSPPPTDGALPAPHRRSVSPRVAAVAAAGLAVLLGAWGLARAGMLPAESGVEATGRTDSPLSRGDWLLVADFDMPGADTALALAFQTLLIQDVGSAGYASVVGGLGAFNRRDLEGVLERMRLPADTRVDPALACQIAEREGAAGVLAGRILPLGSDYVLSASVLTGPGCQERIRASTVTSFDRLSRAVTALSRELRARLGESRSSIRSSPPLPPVTSARIGALRSLARYLAAARLWHDPARGDEPLLEAIRIDPEFGFAHFVLAVHYQRVGRFDQAVPHILRAYELRKDMPRVSQLGMEALYQRYIRSDLDAAAAAAGTALADYPHTADASLPFLADLALWRGDWEQALDVSLRHLLADPSGISADLSLARGGAAAWALGHTALADSLHRMREAMARRARIELDPAAVLLQYIRHRDWPGAEAYCATHAAHDGCAYVHLARGRLAAAGQALQRQLADTVRRHPWDRPAALAGLAYIARLTGQPEPAWALLRRADASMPDSGLARVPLHLNRFLLCAAAAGLGGSRELPACAIEGEDPARWDADPSFSVLLRSGAWSRRLLAVRALERGDPATALARDREAVRSNFGNDVLVDHLIRARAFDARQRSDSALAEYLAASRLERDGAFPTTAGILFPMATVYRRIGELAEAVADTATAIRYYDAFAELWSEADPVLQPQVRATRARLNRLQQYP